MPTINVIVNTYNVIITFVLMTYQLIGKRLRAKSNRLFVYMCICNIVMILGDMTGWLFEGFAKPWYPAALWWGTLIYYISPAPLLLFFVYFYFVNQLFISYPTSKISLPHRIYRRYISRNIPLFPERLYISPSFSAAHITRRHIHT